MCLWHRSSTLRAVPEVKLKAPFAAVFCLSGLCGTLCIGQAKAGPCENLQIPPRVSTVLEKSFPNWRIEKLSDLDPSNQEAWTKKYPDACPGFITGHFQKKDSVGYAFLLLPTQQAQKGYRVVVVVQSAARDRWRSIVLEKGDQQTPSSAAIGLAQPGEYREAEGSRKVHLQVDGIFSEDMGVGVMIYYWHVDRFRNLVISD